MPLSQQVNRPLLISMGCPVGIGPELILRLFGAGLPDAVVVGDPEVLSWCAAEIGLPAPLVAWQPGESLRPGAIAVHTPDDARLCRADLQWGRPTAKTGRAMGRYIEESVALLQKGIGGALVTCPITKTALNLGGYHFPGHTEMLAHLCDTEQYAMMMAGARLRVTLVTIHTALAAVPGLVTRAAVAEMIDLTWQALVDDFAIAEPRLAVAGLNPHGGEAGMFGDEEEKVIAPAVAMARAAGRHVQGPLPPDTVFFKASQGHFDAVVCMYHDQGLIPFKLLHFSDGVNVTLGLPIIRTSVDHGTAYDIAGQGVADVASLAAACDMARQIRAHRSRGRVL
ncbi:MAG: 4-hydroxythreonine-4-phosphate dehydrogenase PdxA [Desulfobulbaceae bacterium]|nr:MAG: 4-hydroxythreonine-4-phosphate dehydrogenase PdxA [Desulfobulbaceae bacterium]